MTPTDDTIITANSVFVYAAYSALRSTGDVPKAATYNRIHPKRGIRIIRLDQFPDLNKRGPQAKAGGPHYIETKDRLFAAAEHDFHSSTDGEIYDI